MIWSIDTDGCLFIRGEGDIPDFFVDNSPPWLDCSNTVLSLRIGEGIVSVGSYAFFGMDNLSELALPQSLQFICSDAFRECTKLTAIELPDTVLYLGSRAFAGCTSAITIELGEGLSRIGMEAFADCPATYVEIPASLTEADYNATENIGVFSGSHIETASISAGTTVIPSNLFAGCTTLKTVLIPDSILSVGDFAFCNATLDTVYYNGSSDLWENVSIGVFNGAMGMSTIHCSTYTISYDANGGDDNVPEAQIKTHGLVLALSTKEPTRTGYTFLGWAENAGAVEMVYPAGGAFTRDTAATLYAVWQENQHAAITSAVRNGNSAYVSISATGNEMTLLLAAYDIDGRLTEVFSHRVLEGSYTYGFTLKYNAAKVTSILIDKNLVPLVKNVVF